MFTTSMYNRHPRPIGPIYRASLKSLVDRLNSRLTRQAGAGDRPTADNGAPAPAPAHTADGDRDRVVAPVASMVYPDDEYDGPDYDECGSMKADYGSPSATEEEGEKEEDEDTGHSRCVSTDISSPCTVDTHGASALESPSSPFLIASTSGAVRLQRAIGQLRMMVLPLPQRGWTGVGADLWRLCQRG